MKLFFIKFTQLLFVLFLILGIFSAHTNAQTNLNDSKGATVSPGYFLYNVKSGEVINDKISLTYININETSLSYEFLEFDKNYQNPKSSELLKTILKAKNEVSVNGVIIETNIDTKSLQDKTFFFGLTIILNSKTPSSSVTPKIALNIPIILTVNSNDTSTNPKPNLKINTKTNFFFNIDDIKTTFQVENQSPKLIDISGEILFLNENNEVLYEEKILIPDNRLLPNTYFQQVIKKLQIDSKNGLPYIGKIKIYYLGTINEKRHIESQVTEIYLFPTQYIVAGVILIVIFSFVPLYFIKKKSKNLSKSTS